MQAQYVRDLKRLIRTMTKRTQKAVTHLFESGTAEEFFTQDASIASQARILTNKLMDVFNQLFTDRAKPLAKKMARNANKLSAINLKTSLKTLSKGLTLKTDFITPALTTITKAVVAENVALIKSISEYYLSSVQKTVLRSITTGNGLKDLMPALTKFKGITERKAENIALDQTRKAYNAINAERMRTIGVRKFEWLHSGGGQKPRQDHIEMNGNIYSFDDLPVIDKKTGERGIPGQAINCGCTMRPIIDFNQ